MKTHYIDIDSNMFQSRDAFNDFMMEISEEEGVSVQEWNSYSGYLKVYEGAPALKRILAIAKPEPELPQRTTGMSDEDYMDSDEFYNRRVHS